MHSLYTHYTLTNYCAFTTQSSGLLSGSIHSRTHNTGAQQTTNPRKPLPAHATAATPPRLHFPLAQPWLLQRSKSKISGARATSYKPTQFSRTVAYSWSPLPPLSFGALHFGCC